MALIFVFLDGVGLAPLTIANPLGHGHMPAVQQLLGAPLVREAVQAQPTLLLREIDACLGVAGLPQSGTGHTALLAGVNAPQLHGRHQPYYPPVALRPLVAEQSIFQRVRQRGEQVAFANVFTDGYWQALAQRRIRKTASVFAAEGAGVRLRDLDDLRAGQGLTWDITGAMLHAHNESGGLSLLAPAVAGQRLALLAHAHALVFFECFLPDLVGHGRLSISVDEVLQQIDGLLGGVLANLRPGDTLVVTSDHGNIEDTMTTQHTRNPVPLLVVGPAAPSFADVETIAGVADAVVAALG